MRSAPSRRAAPTTRPEAIRKRLEIYERETAPLVEYYRTTRGNVVGIHADRPIDEIFAEIRAALDQVAAVIIRKSPEELERMARAGRIVADTLALIGEHARPGVTTAELDELAEEFISGQGGYPTFKGYRGYPAATCISPNSMIVHGIPGPYELADGDILSVDVGVTLDGFVADSAYTFAIGEISAEAERLLDVGTGRARTPESSSAGRQSAFGHLPRGAAGDRGRRVLRRPQPRRARRRAVDARGPADPELRPAGAWARCSPRG